MHTQDVAIKSADKGGGIVPQNRTVYVEEANILLSDKATYVKLNKDPTADFAKEADLLISTTFKDDINPQNWKFLPA